MGSLHRGVGDVLVDELERNLGKYVDGDAYPTYPSDGDSYSDEGSEEIEPYGAELVNCLEKSATCSSPDMKSSTNEDEKEDGEDLRALFGVELLHPAASLPLLSAMKGSREKQGLPARKMSISWAPDVYDPIPNSLSHTVKSKQKKSRKDRDREDNYKNNHKKNGKKGQKGNNASRGSGSKDKKQLRKAGKADKCYRTMSDSDGGSFDVGSPDYCGSSFLKQSAPKFHYSVAEAS